MRAHRVAGEVGIARRRLDLCVAEQLADHRQALSKRQGAAGKAVAQVVNAHIVEAGAGADAPPWTLQVGKVGSRLAARDNPRVVVAGQGDQQPHRRGRQRHGPSAGPGVGKPQLARLEKVRDFGTPPVVAKAISQIRRIALYNLALGIGAVAIGAAGRYRDRLPGLLRQTVASHGCSARGRPDGR